MCVYICKYERMITYVIMFSCMDPWMHACMYVTIDVASISENHHHRIPPPPPPPPPPSSSAPSPSSCSSWPLPCAFCTFGRRRSQRSCWHGQPSGNTIVNLLPYGTLWQPWGSWPSFVNKFEASAYLGEGAMLCWQLRKESFQELIGSKTKPLLSL